MIKSMTGYGRFVSSDDLCDVKIEMRSVNSKYMDVNVRFPRFISYLEVEIRNIVKKALKRCKVDVFIEVKPKKALTVPKLNTKLLETYMSVMNELKELSGVEDGVKLDNLLQFKDLVEFESDDSFADKIKDTVLDAVRACSVSIDEMRGKEGQALIEDISERLEVIAKSRDLISDQSGDVFTRWNEKFKKRLTDMKLPVDDERIIQEASIYAEKADITEEIVRIKSHLEQIKFISENEYPCGKKLDFMSQELHREFNTIGSKSGSVGILNEVVNAKSEIDKIREQIQNIV